MMTVDEARTRVGHTVVYDNGVDEAEDAVITGVTMFSILVRCCSDNRGKTAWPDDLTLPAEYGDLAVSQARLNEIAAGMIRDAPG